VGGDGACGMAHRSVSLQLIENTPEWGWTLYISCSLACSGHKIWYADRENRRILKLIPTQFRHEGGKL
jgi:hypothetical protein